jgi:hypothetical protein
MSMKTVRVAMAVAVMMGLSNVSTAQSDTKALFGELHMHTAWSFDAYLFNTRATPDDAYNFAKGKPLKHPLGQTYQLTRPLDFMAVTDHGMFLGAFAKMADPNHPLSKLPIAEKVNSPDPNVMASAFGDIIGGRNPGQAAKLASREVLTETWDEIVASANRHNDPGTFTALIGYEWTSTPNGQNLHRNVIFRGNDAPPPFTRIQSDVPEDLWAWMDGIRKEGHTVLAIPHNSNLSDGRMFERETSRDTPFTQEYADTRNRNEPLVEVTQVKGTSEAHPALSPNDEFADFEIMEMYVATPVPVTKFAGSYVREAYKTGLEFQEKEGFNPYRFGLVAASDSHTGIVPVDEGNFSGKVGSRDGSAKNRIQTPAGRTRFKFFGASGLAAVWAPENTREGVYDALERKETWGTSGPRIKVRFFGGYDMGNVDPTKDGWIDAAYAGGIPMGGSLQAKRNGDAPTFAVWAMKDAESANLDRIQIVKGWNEDGKSKEQVHDVAWAGKRKMDPKTGKVPAIKNTVNLETLEYENSVGSVELMGTWKDPNFNPNQNAFYYVRVLEIPTPRWSMFDAKELGIPNPENTAKTIQERAYTSPIWYDHH